MKEGNKYLLMIGINKYVHLRKLRNAENDVNGIRELLVNDFGFSKDPPYYEALMDESATRENILRALDDLGGIREPDAKVLIYFAGHGCLHPNRNMGFWVPVDAEKEAFHNFVSNSDIRDRINAIKTRHVLLISDSCFSHSLFRDYVPEQASKTAFDNWEKQESRWIFSSGKGLVADGKANGNSPFAKQIIKYLSRKDREAFNIVGLANEVTIAIQQNYDQEAKAGVLHGAGSNGGQFVFFRKSKEEVEVSYQTALDSTQQEVLQQFLDTTKNAEHKKVIRGKLKALEAKQKEAKKRWEELDKSSFAELDEFMDDYPESPLREEARSLKRVLRNPPPPPDSPKEEPEPIDEKVRPRLLKVDKKILEDEPVQEGLNINSLIALISDRDLEGVFLNPSLNQWFDRDGASQKLKNTMILLQGRYSGLLREERQGTIGRERLNIEKNRISHSLLSLLDSIKKQMKG